MRVSEGQTGVIVNMCRGSRVREGGQIQIPGANNLMQQTVHKRGEEESADRVEWVEMCVMGDL